MKPPPDPIPERENVLSLWRELHQYARSAAADLTDELMVAQPVPGRTMNHPAWIFSHLWAYGPVLAGILRGEPVADPRDHPFGMGSVPADDLERYGAREDVLQRYFNSYAEAAAVYECVGPDVVDRATPVERWLGRFPTVRALPMQFLVRHNATHLGQLSAWRRAMGLPAVS